MTAPNPNGRLVRSPDGLDLVVERTLPGSIDEAWAALTEPDLTARWIGPWEGAAGVGETVRLQLGFEDDAPWSNVTITECAPPRRLRVLMLDEAGSWDLSADLEAGARARLRFVMHGIDPATVGEVAPGWEYYLDALLAAMANEPPPSFHDYFPVQKAYFEDQVR